MVGRLSRKLYTRRMPVMEKATPMRAFSNILRIEANWVRPNRRSSNSVDENCIVISLTSGSVQFPCCQACSRPFPVTSTKS